MGILHLLVNKKSKIDDFWIDATLSVSHSMKSEVTSFPVEEGFNINDHVNLHNKSLIIDGILSGINLAQSAFLGTTVSAALAAYNYALKEYNPNIQETTGVTSGAVNTAGSVALGALSATIGVIQFDADHEAQRQFKKLETLRDARTAFTVSFRGGRGFKEYKNMIFESIDINEDNSTKGVVRFIASMTQLKIVSPTAAGVTEKYLSEVASAKEEKKAASKNTSKKTDVADTKSAGAALADAVGDKLAKAFGLK